MGGQNRPVSAQPKPVSSAAENSKFDDVECSDMSMHLLWNLLFPALASPVKPRGSATSKFDPSNGNRTVGPSGMIPRRSTTLYEKTSSTEKTNVLPNESKYDHPPNLKLRFHRVPIRLRHWQCV